MNKSLLASVAIVLSTSGVLAGGLVNGTLSGVGGIGGILVNNVITGNGAGLTNIQGYNIIKVGNTNYPNLDSAIPIANIQGLPVRMSEGYFPITNSIFCNVPIIGSGPQTIVQTHTTSGTAPPTPNFLFSTNGSVSEFDNFQVQEIWDLGSIFTNNFPYQTAFGQLSTSTIANGALFNKVVFNNIICTNGGSDVVYIQGTGNSTIIAPGGSLTFNNCVFAADWDSFAIYQPAWNVYGFNSRWYQAQNGAGEVPQSGLGTAIAIRAGASTNYFQNCYFSSANTNSITIEMSGGGTIPTFATFVNCVITNSTGTGNDPTNYIWEVGKTLHTNYVYIIGGDINPGGINSVTVGNKANNATCAPMPQYYSDTPIAVTVGASPFTFQNTSYQPMAVKLTDTSAYSYTKNGVPIGGSIAGNNAIVLSPLSTIVVSYLAAAPTMYTNTGN